MHTQPHTHKLIVSRYNEDILWTDNFDCIIYNKGDFLDKSNTFQLPNIGRESHTYLYHIINNYNNLSDINIFCQGRYDDHYNLTVSDFKEKCLDIGLNGYAEFFKKRHDVHGNYFSANPNVNLLGFTHYGILENPTKTKNLQEWYEVVFGEPYETVPYVFWNGIFSVTKQNILKRSLDSYKRLYYYINMNFSNPIDGHYFERMWYRIFNCE